VTDLGDPGRDFGTSIALFITGSTVFMAMFFCHESRKGTMQILIRHPETHTSLPSEEAPPVKGITE